ncbi:MAG: tripartite tricarboxylate transporter substrate binding protein [Betaproteobacteria bacterium]|nr:tripartite tricarboxylate transporter substrate binding protein [Betaproteobacteria bacterium]
MKIITLTLLLVATTANLYAQPYPAKPVRFMVGFAPGGAADITARALAPKLSELLGQQFYIENRPGAGGMLGTDAAAKSPPDGYTLLLMPAADAIQPAVRRKLPYDLMRDFTPVARVVSGPWFLVVHPSVPARSAREFVALARKNPGKLNYATSGISSSAHLTAELLKSLAKIDIVHVPFKGIVEGMTGVAGGEVDLIFASIPSSLPLRNAGRVRALAVTTAERTPLAPDMPTLNESGVPGYDRTGWYGVLAPAGTAREIVTRLHSAIVKIVNLHEMREAFMRQGLEPWLAAPEAFGEFIRGEIAQNIKLVKAAGIKVE